MHRTSLRTARCVGVAAALLIVSSGLALARPGGGHGGFGGGDHGGGFGHAEFGSMHGNNFRDSAMRGSGGHHATQRNGHHKGFDDNEGPAGFSHGNASWKENGGTPPGWSHGNKTGWGCTPGSRNCMPPGLAKKQANGSRKKHADGTKQASHTKRASHSRMTPVSDKQTPKHDSKTSRKRHGEPL